VKADAQGNILRGSAPDRYVELEISYQKTPNVPYALPAPPGKLSEVPTIQIQTVRKQVAE
jgi:hypothetical protein